MWIVKSEAFDQVLRRADVQKTHVYWPKSGVTLHCGRGARSDIRISGAHRTVSKAHCEIIYTQPDSTGTRFVQIRNTAPHGTTVEYGGKTRKLSAPGDVLTVTEKDATDFNIFLVSDVQMKLIHRQLTYRIARNYKADEDERAALINSLRVLGIKEAGKSEEATFLITHKLQSTKRFCLASITGVHIVTPEFFMEWVDEEKGLQPRPAQFIPVPKHKDGRKAERSLLNTIGSKVLGTLNRGINYVSDTPFAGQTAVILNMKPGKASEDTTQDIMAAIWERAGGKAVLIGNEQEFKESMKGKDGESLVVLVTSSAANALHGSGSTLLNFVLRSLRIPISEDSMIFDMRAVMDFIVDTKLVDTKPKLPSGTLLTTTSWTLHGAPTSAEIVSSTTSPVTLAVQNQRSLGPISEEASQAMEVMPAVVRSPRRRRAASKSTQSHAGGVPLRKKSSHAEDVRMDLERHQNELKIYEDQIRESVQDLRGMDDHTCASIQTENPTGSPAIREDGVPKIPVKVRTMTVDDGWSGGTVAQGGNQNPSQLETQQMSESVGVSLPGSSKSTKRFRRKLGVWSARMPLMDFNNVSFVNITSHKTVEETIVIRDPHSGRQSGSKRKLAANDTTLTMFDTRTQSNRMHRQPQVGDRDETEVTATATEGSRRPRKSRRPAINLDGFGWL
eukprot:Clim_evm42s195 gene=Clim_evmTU42s195